MKKPSWENAPFWAEWLAQNYNGEWHWYELMPKQGIDGWFTVSLTEYRDKAKDGKRNAAWWKTLEAREDHERKINNRLNGMMTGSD